MNIRSCLACLLTLPVLLLSASLQATTTHVGMPLPYERPALMSDRAIDSVIVGLALAGERLVAVGEHGVILLSDDHGQSWRQVATPVSVTLTAVHFPDIHHGWAVGHSGIILHTRDGGETWSRQFDGRMAAEAVQQRVEAMLDGLDEERAWALQDYAGLLLDDGPDKPFLDVLFLDERTGFVIGAFGMIFHTQDAGQSWEPWFERIDNPDNLHMYALRSHAQRLVIIGEQGLYLTSDDAGQRFSRQQPPYDGSFFTVTPLPGGSWLLAGLRGNAFIHDHKRDRYQKLSVPAPVTFNDSTTLADGRALLVNHAGQVFQLDIEAKALTPLALQPMPPLAGIAQVGDGNVVVAGFRGPVRLENVVEAASRGAEE